ncbi:MAG: hypothetical protein L0Z62_19675 [Gemmataceae bacterium]|nr:hypothetical protein [Gemmataceae bacterium]
MGLDYKFLSQRGALGETYPEPVSEATPAALPGDNIPPSVLELIPARAAREHLILPLAFDGETITCAAVDPDNIALQDRIRFMVAKNVRFVPALREELVEAINRHYGSAEAERSMASMMGERTDHGIDYELELDPCLAAPSPPRSKGGWGLPLALGSLLEFKKGVKGLEDEASSQPGLDRPPMSGDKGMFFYVVEEGQRVLVRHSNGTLEVVIGPKRIWRGRKTFAPLRHYVAHPGKFLVVRYRDGREEHLTGPAEMWLDPREHFQVTVEDALQLSAKEAVVVYSGQEGGVTRRIVYGPALFVPRPGEWLHTFSWHASQGGSRGVAKEPNKLVFQKLWLMPDQMYHDVPDVRTADDAVLTVRLMIFFELADIERMLDATHDPIGDFVNAATSDAVAFTARYDFEQFKRHTGELNELETYRQLTGRASQCGYRINKVVFRGYGAADSLQEMHNKAIEARTRLQLDRATEQQAQDLENYKLDCQLARASRRRTEQVVEVDHDLSLARKRQDEEARLREAQLAAAREAKRLEADLTLAIRRGQDTQQREQLATLREMGVDLTAYLTQARADQVIELRGGGGTHVHLEKMARAKQDDGKT